MQIVNPDITMFIDFHIRDLMTASFYQFFTSVIVCDRFTA